MNDLELRDIHLPDVALWWPPAPGWWIILTVGLVLLFVLPRLWRWLRYQSTRKLSQNAFRQIIKNYNRHQDQRRIVVELSSLLRRIVMSYRGRNQTAGLTGSEWVKQLDGLVDTACFSDEQIMLLTHGQYAAVVDIDCNALIRSCDTWIKALPGRPQHVSV